jgi:hypothetical protein
MKTFFSFFLLLFFSNNPNLAEIRKAFPTAAASEITATAFAAKLADVTFEDKTVVAYKGASITMVAKFKKKVSEKISAFKEGSKLIESAVASEPNNIEIRLIRLSIQENVPGIVNYKKSIKEDAAYILKHFKEQNTVLKEYIRSFVLQSKSFSAEEKQTIK